MRSLLCVLLAGFIVGLAISDAETAVRPPQAPFRIADRVKVTIGFHTVNIDSNVHLKPDDVGTVESINDAHGFMNVNFPMYQKSPNSNYWVHHWDYPKLKRVEVLRIFGLKVTFILILGTSSGLVACLICLMLCICKLRRRRTAMSDCPATSIPVPTVLFRKETSLSAIAARGAVGNERFSSDEELNDVEACNTHGQDNPPTPMQLPPAAGHEPPVVAAPMPIFKDFCGGLFQENESATEAPDDQSGLTDVATDPSVVGLNEVQRPDNPTDIQHLPPSRWQRQQRHPAVNVLCAEQLECIEGINVEDKDSEYDICCRPY